MTARRRRSLRLVHIGIHERRNANAGDTLLFQALRDLFERVAGSIEWDLRQVWDPFDVEDARALAGSADAVLVGGGGLLLRDQRGSDTSRSGWQWNATPEAVRALEVPLVVAAVGYNRFRGQPDFDPPFTEHLAAVAERATLLGLRNTGSIRAVGPYLPDQLRDVPTLLSCPTTVLRQLYELGASGSSEGRNLGVNFAFDRAGHRFGDGQARTLSAIARAVRGLERRGWRVHVLQHKEMDAAGHAWLDEAGVRYAVRELSAAGSEAIIEAYRDLDLVVGMRGHGQLIPFGLAIPIVSVVTHDKLAWFLEDLGRPTWGVDPAEPQFAERLSAELDRAGRPDRRDDVDALQRTVWERTLGTVEAVVGRVRALTATDATPTGDGRT